MSQTVRMRDWREKKEEVNEKQKQGGLSNLDTLGLKLPSSAWELL